MSNKRDLKAFVRFDGSGRIVAGSLILRKNKPKVGKWHEIQAYECCNYIPSPSTTTTTTTQGSVTPTSFMVRITGGQSEACGDEFGIIDTVYSSSTTLGLGSYLYYDEALTQPVGGQLWVRVLGQSVVYTVLFGEIIEVNSCPTAYRIGNIERGSFNQACSNMGDLNGGTNLFAASGSSYTVGTQLYLDFNLTVPYTGNGWYPVMIGWPISGAATGMFVTNGVINAALPC